MRNFFNNLFFYLLFLGIGTNVLTSCKEEVESISELSLEQTKIQIKEGETVTVKIIGGSGNYQISLSDEKLAVAQIENNEINIRALLTGCVTLTVTDENGQTALLNIIIISKILDSDKPRFVWTNSIALDEPNGWGLTVFGNKVAVTSCVEQIQYVLEWEGDSTMGQKKKVFMSFALATNTSLLLMDEPTNGLDIPGKSQFRKLIASGMTDDKTILNPSTY